MFDAKALRYPFSNLVKKRSIAWLNLLSFSEAFKTFEHNAGESVNAVILEKNTAALTAIANSVNSAPIRPSINTNGTNTEISTRVVAIIAKPTSRAPR